MWRSTCVLIGLATLAVASPVAAGELDRARDDIEGSRDDDDDDDGERDDDDDDDDDDESLAELVVDLTVHLIGRQLASPPVAYAPYPYHGGHPGYVVEADALQLAQLDAGPQSDVAPPVMPRRTKPVGVPIALHYGALGDLTGAGLEARVLLPIHLELGTRASFYGETLADGGDDSAFVGVTHVGLRIVEATAAQSTLALGVAYWLDGQADTGGLDLAWSFDLFPVRPLIVSLRASVGTLGEATTLGGRATAGVMLQGIELFGGYEHLHVGDADLGIALVGTRFWL